jgi:hypothetical protein
MSEPLEIYKNRTNIVKISLGVDISADTFVSEIRAEKSMEATLIASFTPSFLTDGTDGELVLTVDNSALTAVTVKYGYMDIKRVSNGEPLQAIAPVKVVFKDAVTA